MESIYLYRDDNGNIQKATAGEPIDRKFIQSKVDAASAELHQWSNVLARYDDLAGTKKPADQPTGTADAIVAEDDGDGHVTFSKKKIDVQI